MSAWENLSRRSRGSGELEGSVGGVASTPPRVVHASRPSVPVSAGGSLSSRFPLFKVEDPNSYCLGVIGSELKNDRFPRFCLEARGECTFSTHQSRHFRGQIQPGFYPKGTTRGRAFCYKTPFLSLEEGIPEARTRVLVGERSLVDWIKICEALPGTQEDALDDLLRVTTVFPNDLSVARSPAKKRVARVQTVKDDDDSSVLGSQPDSGGLAKSPPNKLPKLDLSVPGNRKEAVSTVLEGYDELVTIVQMNQTSVAALQEDSLKHDSCIRDLRARVYMKETQDSWDAPPVEYALIQKKLADITDKIVEVMKVNADLRSELDEVKTTTTQVQNDIADTRQTAVFIDQEVQNLSRNMTQGANVPNIRQDVITQLSEVTTDLQKELAELKDNYKVLDSKGQAQTVQASGETFSSLEEVKNFLKKHVPEGHPFPVGCFLDFPAVLQMISARHLAGSDKTQLKVNFKRANTTERSFHANLQGLSYELIWPDLFHEMGRDSLCKDNLNKLTSFKAWHNPSGQGIVERVDSYLDEVFRDAKMHVRNNPTLSALVDAMNACTRNFWAVLKTFVSDFYSELKDNLDTKLVRSSDEDMKESWNLIREMMAAAFKQLHDGRSSGVGLGGDSYFGTDEDQGLELAASYLWGALQGFKVQQDLTKRSIKRHNCVMPSLYLFLFSHRAPTTAVNRIEKIMDELTKSTKGHQSSIDKLTSQVKKLELAGNRRAGNNNNNNNGQAS